MIRLARSRLRLLLKRAGIEVSRRTVLTSAELQLDRLLRHCGIDLVLDVGANGGQYAAGLRWNGYAGRIVSFEPMAAAYEQLRLAAGRHGGWEVAPRMALGESDGDIEIHIAGNSVSSSILDMLPAHERATPESAYVGREVVPMRRLDSVGAPFLAESRRVLLKIDTQGYEDRVLAGAKGLLHRFTAIQAELSLVPLYAGQPLYVEMLEKIEALGFVLYAIFPSYVDGQTGRTLQFDGFFLRRELAGGS
ncbi:MAG: FkbM family methyltransferase [Burkholderiales bacterium]